MVPKRTTYFDSRVIITLSKPGSKVLSLPCRCCDMVMVVWRRAYMPRTLRLGGSFGHLDLILGVIDFCNEAFYDFLIEHALYSGTLFLPWPHEASFWVPVFQFTLHVPEYQWWVHWKMTYCLCWIAICRSEPSDCIGIIAKCMILVCRKVELLYFRSAWTFSPRCLRIFRKERCISTSAWGWFLWELGGMIWSARSLLESPHRVAQVGSCCVKEVESVVCVQPKFGKCMQCC